jgi:hypothetical protein
MREAKIMRPTWKEWLAPGVASGVVLAVITWQLANIRDRFSSLDAQYADVGHRLTALDSKVDLKIDGLEKRIAETNQNITDAHRRIDIVLQQQNTTSSQLGGLERDVSYLKSQVDRIALKVQASAFPVEERDKGAAPVVTLSPEQRKIIRETILRAGSNSRSARFDIRIGAVVPSDVQLRNVPPQFGGGDLQRYQYVVVNEQAVFVDPTTRTVVEVVK